MAKTFLSLLAVLGCAGWMAAAPAAAADAPGVAIPAERFFGHPAMRSAALSPNGRWLASLVYQGGAGERVNLQVQDLDGVEPPRLVKASASDDVYWFQWVTDDWLVFSLDDADAKRDAFRGPGLFAMRRDGSDLRMLISRAPEGTMDVRGVRVGPLNVLPPKFRFVGLGAPGSLNVILRENEYDVDGEYMYTRFRELNIETRKWQRIFDDAPRPAGYLFDGQARLRLVQQVDGKQLRFLWSDVDAAGKQGAWREIATTKVLENTWSPAYVDPRGDLYVTADDAQGFTELRKFDTSTRKLADPPLVATPGFDGGASAIRGVAGGPVLGVRLLVDSATTAWFDPRLQALQERVDARWPGRVNLMYCRPCDDPQRLLVFSYADTDPGQYLLFYPARNEWKHLGAVRPDIDQRRMAPVAFERIKARDGRDLPVWITRSAPPAGAAAKPGPAVLLLHGGPHMRGKQWEWDAEAQFLASRGYTVIEPEFRGSMGFGAQHYRAGWKQWGTGMIDDITDAARYAVKAGLADPSRLCVMGASYGGYGTLMSLVKEPDMYRCGIAFAAVTDPRNRFDFFWSDLSMYNRKTTLPLLLGDPVADADMFVATSPVAQVERIKAPILLMHGDSDYRVPLENGERMRDALQRAGKRVEWVAYQDEGHGFATFANELDYWQRIEAFLAKHLK